MPLHRDILRQIASATSYLVEQGLADDQNLPYEVQRGPKRFVVQYSTASGFGLLLRDRPYVETYADQLANRSYNVRMLDGALIQMTYEFESEDLTRYRLAFLPSPDLLEFQNNAEIYMEDLLYADVVEQRVVTVPLRFDFDAAAAIPLAHPASHLTLGQYSQCRIPAVAPLTPFLFIEFLLRSFYNGAVGTVSDALPKQKLRFAQCIHADERSVVHVGVPT